MKISKQEATFQPVTIVLESQEEVDQMYAIMSCVNVEGSLDITLQLYESLMDFEKEGSHYYVDGDTLVKKK